MSRWTIDSPVTLDFDGVVALRVRVIAGSVAVLTTADRPRLEVTEVTGQPLLVTHEAGILTVTYEDLTWDGLLGWLRPQRHSATITITVQKDCPTQLGVVNATAVVSGVSDIDFYIPPNLWMKHMVNQPLISCPRVLQTEGHHLITKQT